MGTHENQRRRSRSGPVPFFGPLEGVEACFFPTSCFDPDESSQRLAGSSNAAIPIESRSEFWRSSDDRPTKVYRHRVCKIRVYRHRVPKVSDDQPDGHQTGLRAGNVVPIAKPRFRQLRPTSVRSSHRASDGKSRVFGASAKDVPKTATIYAAEVGPAYPTDPGPALHRTRARPHYSVGGRGGGRTNSGGRR